MSSTPLGAFLRLELDEVGVDPSETYPIAGVYGFGRGLFAREPVLGSQTSYRKLNRLSAGKFMVSRLKAFEGAVAVVPQQFDGFFASQEFPTFAIDERVALRSYVDYVSKWPEFWRLLAASSKGVGARRERVHPTQLLAVEIPLPDVAQQHEIVRRLDATYRRLKQIDHDAYRASTLTTGLRAAAIPLTARRVALGTVLEQVARAEEVHAAHEYRLLGVRSFGLGCFDSGTRQGAETRYRVLHRVAAGDFVFPKLMAWEGAFAVVPERFDGYFVSPEFCTFQALETRLNIDYLGMLFQVPEIWSSVAGSSVGTNVRRKRLYPKEFLAREIPLPDLAQQERVAELGSRIDDVVRLSSHRGDLAAALRVSALNDAFRVAA